MLSQPLDMASPSCPSLSLHTTASRRKPYTPTCIPPRMRIALSIMAVAASLIPAVAALPSPPQITSPSRLEDSVSVLAVDVQIPITSHPGSTLFRSRGPELRRRQNGDDEEEEEDDPRETTSEEDGQPTTSQRSTRSEDDEPETTNTRSLTVTISAPQTTPTVSPTPSPLPQPFDDAVPGDFRAAGGDNSCPTFMTNLLADPSFRQCYPISMMMMTSTAYFNAQRNLPSVVRILDEACNADVSYCSNYLSQAARNLTQEANCRQEYNANLSTIMQAYNGLRTYEMLYAATCLLDRETDMYCYASAVTNVTHPSDGRFYFMPLGLGLPGSSTPSCSWCTQETMAIFHSASADRSQAISGVYEDAAHQVNSVCGPSFVDDVLPSPDSASSIVSAPTYFMALFTVGAVAMHVFL